MDLQPLQDVAAHFHIGHATLYRYLRDGQLQRYRRKFDRRTYVDCDEVRQLLEPRPVPRDKTGPKR